MKEPKVVVHWEWKVGCKRCGEEAFTLSVPGKIAGDGTDGHVVYTMPDDIPLDIAHDIWSLAQIVYSPRRYCYAERMRWD